MQGRSMTSCPSISLFHGGCAGFEGAEEHVKGLRRQLARTYQIALTTGSISWDLVTRNLDMPDPGVMTFPILLFLGVRFPSVPTTGLERAMVALATRALDLKETSISVATATNVSAQVSNIPMLSGTNFKVWKETVEIVLGCMDLDLALRSDQPFATPENPNEGKSAKKFLKEIQQYFAKNEKSEASNLLAKLVAMKYKGKGNIREYITKMSHLTSKLKSLKLELFEDLLVHSVLISLPAHFGQFKVSYNSQKDKWSLNELISHCVQEEERQQRDRIENAHLASTSQNEKRKRAKVAAEDLLSRRNKRSRLRREQRPGPFAIFLNECGIVPQYTMSGKPSMNGVAE
ncbi:hypothetical protein HHK36_015565 [Tetracentron sinense]|uniref:Uncharacterized protein n=1 Tax=Tetracentron sinense TaxID=13715 RepID=A0A834Z3A3_TETSI|nr:hypothetical protein HHK36_015565 [Tetracentron sinense]